MKKSIFLWFVLAIAIAACQKVSEDVAPATVPERLEINPTTRSRMIGDTAKFTLTYFNTIGEQATLPTGIVWSSANTSIATVDQNGIATGVAAGQVNIKATYNNAEATALLTVVANNSDIATVMINTAIQEVNLNEMATLMATARNNAGDIITGNPITWQSASTNLVSIDATGKVTGLGYGTANITATVLGIQSSPTMVQVIRSGNLTVGTGTAKLKIESGILKLQTSSNFAVSNAPDLRVYLSNNPNNISDAIEIATLPQKTGAQSWNIPSNVSITQYRYFLVWCKQFGGTYGRADFGTL